jgi:hypothetical protein
VKLASLSFLVRSFLSKFRSFFEFRILIYLGRRTRVLTNTVLDIGKLVCWARWTVCHSSSMFEAIIIWRKRKCRSVVEGTDNLHVHTYRCDIPSMTVFLATFWKYLVPENKPRYLSFPNYQISLALAITHNNDVTIHPYFNSISFSPAALAFATAMKLSFSAFCLAVAASSAVVSVDAFVPHHHYDRYHQNSISSTVPKTILNYVNVDQHPEVGEGVMDMATILPPTAALIQQQQQQQQQQQEEEAADLPTIALATTKESVSPTVAQMASFIVNQMSLVLGYAEQEAVKVGEETTVSLLVEESVVPQAAPKVVKKKSALPFYAKALGTGQTSTKKDTTAHEDTFVHRSEKSTERTTKPIPFFATRVPSKPAFQPKPSKVQATVSEFISQQEQQQEPSPKEKPSFLLNMVESAIQEMPSFINAEMYQMAESTLQHARRSAARLSPKIQVPPIAWGELLSSTASAAFESVSDLAREYAATHPVLPPPTAPKEEAVQGRIRPTAPRFPPKLELFDTARILQQVAELRGQQKEVPLPSTITAPTTIGSGLDFSDIDSLLMDVESVLELAEACIH